MFAPVVEFETERGEKVEFVSSYMSTNPSEKVGDTVDLLYNPRAPQSASINTFLSLWFTPMLVGSLGAIFSTVGALLIILSLKNIWFQRTLYGS